MSKPCIYIVNAAAGHGKDYTMSILEEVVGQETTKIFFAEKAKNIIATSLKKEFLTETKTDAEKENVLNHLKDNDFTSNVFGKLNMRETLQLMLGDIIRTINPQIHVLFTLKKIEQELKKGSKNLLVCTDNRYKNEQEGLYPLNLMNNNEERIDYIHWKINQHKTPMSDLEILSLFDKLTEKLDLDEKDIEMLRKIKLKFVKEVNIINETQQSKNDYSDFVENIDYNNISQLSSREAFEKGLINVFRPLVHKNVKEENLEEEIIKYNKMSNKDFETIKNNYGHYEIEFNVENVLKYGFLRANPKHPSETDLEGRKPQAILNTPSHLDGGLKNEILNYYKDSQKKNLLRKYNYDLKNRTC